MCIRDSNKALQTFPKVFESAMVSAFYRRLGLRPSGEGDFDFVMALLRWMDEANVPFEQAMFDLFCFEDARMQKSPVSSVYQGDGFKVLRQKVVSHEKIEPGRLSAAYFSGKPETMLIDEVENIWAAIDEDDDWSRFTDKIEAIREMGAAYRFEASLFPPHP